MNNELIEKRKQTLEKWLTGIFSPYSFLEFKTRLNDHTDDDEPTAFEVDITNTTNNRKHCEVLNVDKDDEIGLLIFEEFDGTDELDFVMHLFMSQFLTFVEA